MEKFISELLNGNASFLMTGTVGMGSFRICVLCLISVTSVEPDIFGEKEIVILLKFH